MKIAEYIDHTLLKPESTKTEIELLCREAMQYKFASVCVHPEYVQLCVSLLKDTIPVCTVVGFPYGNNTSEIKVHETRRAVQDGAKEIDMVINVGFVKDGEFEKVRHDIIAVLSECKEGVSLKVIIEAALLNDEQKSKLTELIAETGAHFVKTSTGTNSAGGATVQDVELLVKIGRPLGLKVKAAGGIRSRESALEMIHAGADRIGASASVSIVKGENLS